MAGGCSKCYATAHHEPSCPEMFWPDGRPRGQVIDLPPLPPLLTPKQRERFKIQHPGGWSPIGEQMGRIFAGVTEKMVSAHIREARRGHGDE